MICPNCNGENVQTTLVQTSSRIAHKSTGFGGHMNNAARTITAFSTAGMSNLVWKKSNGGSKQKFRHTKTALCQDCGFDWKVK